VAGAQNARDVAVLVDLVDGQADQRVAEAGLLPVEKPLVFLRRREEALRVLVDREGLDVFLSVLHLRRGVDEIRADFRSNYIAVIFAKILQTNPENPFRLKTLAYRRLYRKRRAALSAAGSTAGICPTSRLATEN
jgi:hypothetical protein